MEVDPLDVKEHRPDNFLIQLELLKERLQRKEEELFERTQELQKQRNELNRQGPN